MTARREQQRAAFNDQIKATARRLMGEHGTAGVSLRMIARELEMSAPSLYHYFASYDALITALILDAFTAFAVALEQVEQQVHDQVAVARLAAVASAYRGWALDHPIDFQLIYGNPLPGFHAPRELTVPASARGLMVVARAFDAALAGRPVPTLPMQPPPETAAFLASLQAELDSPITTTALYAAIVAWSRIHGVVMLELFGHLQPAVGNPDTFFQAQVQAVLHELGVEST